MLSIGTRTAEGSEGWIVAVVIAAILLIVVIVTLAIRAHIARVREDRNNYRWITPPSQRKGLL